MKVNSELQSPALQKEVPYRTYPHPSSQNTKYWVVQEAFNIQLIF